MKVFYKYLYIDQPERKRWHPVIGQMDFAAFLKGQADIWEFLPINLRAIMIGFGTDDGKGITHEGTVLVDKEGRLVYQRGTEIQVLKTAARKPEALNLLPPEMRKHR